jgi:hypothetical protein
MLAREMRSAPLVVLFIMYIHGTIHASYLQDVSIVIRDMRPLIVVVQNGKLRKK